MKKAISLFLALLMCLSLLPASALAAEFEDAAEPAAVEDEADIVPQDGEAVEEEVVVPEDDALEPPENEEEVLLPDEDELKQVSDEAVLDTPRSEDYTITLDANGGYFNGDLAQTQTAVPVPAGVGYYLPAVKNGIAHSDPSLRTVGWCYDAAGTDPIETDEYSNYFPTGDVTLYAHWVSTPMAQLGENQVGISGNDRTTVFFIPETSGTYRIESLQGGDPYLSVLTMENSQVGADDSSAGNGQFLLDCELTAGVKYQLLVGDWNGSGTVVFSISKQAAETYTITFDANGGFFGNDEGNTQLSFDITPGEAINHNPAARINGENMCWDGWYLDRDGTGDAIDPWTYIPEGSMTLYAKWVQVYRVTFDANGGYFNGDTTQTQIVLSVEVGDSVWLTPDKYGIANSDTTLHVEGWYFDADGTDPVETDEYDNYYPSGNVTLYAKWVQVYRVTFDANGGYFNGDESCTTQTVTITAGNPIGNMPWPETSADHMSCSGAWYFDPACTERCNDPEEYVPEGDLTLYAEYYPVWIVEVDANGGYFYNDPTRTSIEYFCRRGFPFSASICRDGISHPDGLYMEGLYFDQPCTQPAAVGEYGEYTPEGDIKLYAKWVEDSPALTAQLGENYVEINGSEPVTLIFTPEESGFYTFASFEGGDPHIFIYDMMGNMVGNDDDGGGNLQFRCTCGLNAGESYQLSIGDWSQQGTVGFTISKSEVYTITFDANGGNFEFGDQPESKEFFVEQGATLMFSATPVTNDGRFFGGWCTDPNGDGEMVSVDGTYTPSGDMRLYAIWIMPSIARLGDNSAQVSDSSIYYLTFTAEEAGWYSFETVEKISVALDGYPNGSWQDSKSGEQVYLLYNLEAGQTCTIGVKAWDDASGTITLRIEKATVCTITFLSEYGYIFGDEDQTEFEVTAAVGKKLDVWPGVYGADKSFRGWSLTPGGAVISDSADYVPTGDTTFYAVWSELCSIVFDANGGYFFDGSETTCSFTAASGEELYPVSDPDINDPHKIFDGWYLDEDCTQLLEWPCFVESDMTLYAGWAEAYSITFDANGGFFPYHGDDETVTQETLKIKVGVPIGNRYYTPIHGDKHFAFSGSWLAPDDSVIENVSRYIPTGDVTLRAVWTAAYAVCFDYMGGEIPGRYGDKLELAIPIGKAICTVSNAIGNLVVYDEDGMYPIKVLRGWYLDAACTQPVSNPFGLVPTGDMTFYAGYDDACRVSFERVEQYHQTMHTTWVRRGGYVTERDVSYYGEDVEFFLDHDCTVKVNPTTYKITEDITFYSRDVDPLAEGAHTVILDANGGVPVYSGIEGSVVYRPGESFWMRWVFERPDQSFVRDGYIAAGWVTSPDGTEPIDGDELVTEDMTIYILWKSAVEVTLDANGKRYEYYGNYANASSITISAPSEGRLLNYIPDYEYIYSAGEGQDGPRIEGWYLDSGCTRRVGEDYTVTGPVTLYANWVMPYFITIDINGGSFVYDELYSSSSAVLPGRGMGWEPAVVAPHGLVADGWSFERNGEKFCEHLYDFVPTGDATVYARWTPGHMLYLDAGDGYFYGDRNLVMGRLAIPSGESIGNRLVGIDDGCDRVVTGWYYDRACTQSVGDVRQLVLTEDMTIYAKWGEPSKEFALSLTLDKDSYECGERVDYAAAITNADGGTAGLDAYADTEITVSVLYEDGAPVEFMSPQVKVGLEIDGVFPLADERLDAGYYIVAAECEVDGQALYAEQVFYFGGYYDLDIDLTGCTLGLTLESTILHEGDGLWYHVTVTDANGDPVKAVKVLFYLLDADGSSLGLDGWDNIYNVTGEDGRCGLSYYFDEEPAIGTYIARVEAGDLSAEVPFEYLGVYKTGWQKENGDWYYYDEDGRKVVNGWAADSTGTCWMGADGKMVKSKWVQVDGYWYYIEASGYRKENGWMKDSVGWCYLGEDGRMLTSTWKADSKGTCWLDENGRMAIGKWIEVDGGRYYMDANGYRTENGWAKDTDGWRFMGEDGLMVTSTWKKDSKGWCYLKDDGYMAVSEWVEDGGARYYLDGSGYMVTGWKQIDGEWYFFQSSGALKVSAWEKDKGGWYYLDADGRITKNQWVEDGGARYYMGANGYMVTGWKQIDGFWYYFQSSGKLMVSGWMKDSKGWCYLGEDGKMVTNGWATDSKGFCWMGADGYMVEQTKWIEYDGGWYYIDKGYRVQNTWKKDSKGWCYLGEDGRMVTNGWANDSKGACWIGPDGYMIEETMLVEYEGETYGIEKGYMVVDGSIEVDGVTYTFDANGILIP